MLGIGCHKRQGAHMTIAGSPDQKLNRRLRLGMVGGGRGAFIGAVHRIAARLDDRWELVAGALSSDPERATASGEDLLPRAGPHLWRLQRDGAPRAAAEGRHRRGRHRHAEPRPCGGGPSLPEGRHPCDLRQAADDDAARGRGAGAARARIAACIFAVTHNYTGYPLVRQARAMVQAGELGRFRVVQVEYAQDWLATRIEETGQQAGATGAPIRRVPARPARSATSAPTPSTSPNSSPATRSPVSVGRAAHLRGGPAARRQCADDAALRNPARRACSGAARWRPAMRTACASASMARRAGSNGTRRTRTVLTFSPLGEPPRLIRRNGSGADAVARAASRIPGRPSGRLSRRLRAALHRHRRADRRADRGPRAGPVRPARAAPSSDGVRGVRFIEAAVKSSAANGAWTAV